TPIQQGHTKSFYNQVILFMRNLFSGGLKDNKHLSFGFLTGILRVAKESIFSGLNNLAINSVLDDKYSSYFGFTSAEVKAMARYYRAGKRFDELCQWYDGYQFGNTEIFNPWSVINYFRNDCRPGAYWQSTGSNEIIGEVLAEADTETYDRLRMLLQGESFLTYIDTGVIYPEIRNNPSSVYSFLLVAGYLRVQKSDATFTDGFMCEVALPNKEIAFVYKKEILDKLTPLIPQSTAISIQEAIYSGRADVLQAQIRQLLLHTVSVYDTAGENFYHGLVLGLCAVMDNRFEVTSNRESGEGRYDIQLRPRANDLPGILIELKAAKKGTNRDLKALAQTALEQINQKDYAAALRSQGVETIFKYGVAFSGKNVEVLMG
ncbi:MAG: AAA family ATPase, partial [Oscillospiraceae bacterium]|nr:AAA family ATPase [Oscillospiraceae bacterium]